MSDYFTRMEELYGSDNMKKLADARVAVFGLGGVGGFAAEALVRSGVGHVTLIDGDTVSSTNINRQLAALTSTVGEPKADVLAARFSDINPDAEIVVRKEFFKPDNADTFDIGQYDAIIDAVDMVTAKLELIMRAREHGVFIVCAMGAGGKKDPTLFRAADIYETTVCPLAKVMRKECRARGVEALRVVYSTEEPVKFKAESAGGRKPTDRAPGSAVFAAGACGLVLASEVVRHLTNGEF